jgi:hypothetical protein
MEPTAAPAGLAGDLVLARLLPPMKRPPSPGRVRADVARFFRDRPSDERWQEMIDALVGAGLATAKPLRLTDAGRARALQFLGVGELPPRSSWGTIQAKFLAPKALGLSPADADALRRYCREDNLAALLLTRRFCLALGPNAGLGAALEALACRELGFPESTTWNEVKGLALARLIHSDEPLDEKRLKKALPRVLLGARTGGVRGLRGVLLDGWADGGQPASSAQPTRQGRPEEEKPQKQAEPAEFDLPAFARTVRAAARDCPAGRFGDNKVFIAHVWRRLRDEPGFPPMDLPAFKQRLTEANNAGLLTLSRADLVQVMDPEDVRESQTRYLNAEFHFVLLDKEQP